MTVNTRQGQGDYEKLILLEKWKQGNAKFHLLKSGGNVNNDDAYP